MTLVLVLLPSLMVGCSLSLDAGGADAPAYRGSDPLNEDGESLPSTDDDDAEAGDDDAGDDDDDDDDDDDMTGASNGKAAVISLDPAPGSVDHHYRRPITVTFDGDGSSAMFSVMGPDEHGTQHSIPLLPPQWNDDGTLVELSSTESLWPSSEYTVSIEQNDSVLEYSFSTSSVGEPLNQGVLIDSLSYSISPSEGFVVAPTGLAPLLAGMSADFSWLWQFHEGQSPSELSVDTGAGSFDASDLVQDSCTPTVSLLSQDATLDLDGGYFSQLSASASFWLGDALIELEDASIDGDFSSDASTIEEVALSGWLDVASLASLVSMDVSPAGSADTPCDWVQQSLGEVCQACPSGSGDCIWVHVRSLSGELLAQPLTVVDSTLADPCDGDDAFSSAVSCALSASTPSAGLAWLLLPAAALLRRRR
jgi:hypothetical protein